MDFVNANMLSSDLSQVGLLVLANQCWDEDLMHQVGRSNDSYLPDYKLNWCDLYPFQAAEKLSRELPEGSVVVEYTGRCFRRMSCFTKVAQVTVPVSWNENQGFHVYVKHAAESDLNSGS